MKIYFQDKSDYRIAKYASLFVIIISSFLLSNYLMNPKLPDSQTVIITQMIAAFLGTTFFLSIKHKIPNSREVKE